MKVGDVVGMTSCEIHSGSKKDTVRMRHTVTRGRRLVFLVLGVEEIDGELLDAAKTLNQLGWSNPDFPTSVSLTVSDI